LNYTAASEARIIKQREHQDAKRAAAARALEEEARAMEAEKEAQRRQQAESEARIAAKDAERKQREQKECELQRICETSDELRELEKALAIAYMNKERAAQHEERQLLDHLDKEWAIRIDEDTETRRRLAVQTDRGRGADPRFDRQMLKADIQKQLVEQERRRQELESATAAQDKALVQAAVKRAQQEEADRHRALARKREEVQQMHRKHEEARERIQREQQQRDAEEEVRIQHYQAMQIARKSHIRQRQDERRARQEAVVAKIVAEAKQKQADEEELETLRTLLHAEKAEASRLAREEAKWIKKQKDRDDLRRAQEEQLRLKARQVAWERVREEKMVAEMQAKFEAESRREADITAHRRQADATHQMRLREQLEDGRRRVQAEHASEHGPSREEAAKEAYKQQVVTEARRRLLKEHASLLGEFLPKNLAKEVEEGKRCD